MTRIFILVQTHNITRMNQEEFENLNRLVACRDCNDNQNLENQQIRARGKERISG
jgi:hypothetical protein